uniref:TIAM Rac1 associated GEF 1 n=1 Tax=Hippocampus comes TaxID=109280 RepID=A0A3Q2ZKT1_HIPCM
MGNAESQHGEHAFFGAERGYLSRKHMSRSLRISNKQSRRCRHASSGKIEHRNSEASTRSSSTPSIPQSLAENGLEPFNETNVLPDFGSPIWVDRVAMNLRPMSFHRDPASPAAHGNTMLITLPGPTADEVQDEDGDAGEVTYLRDPRDGSKEAAGFKKKRSKSADTWRDDSLEFSLSDLSQDPLTSTEEMITPCAERDSMDREGPLQSSPADPADRANSFDELYSQKTPGCRQPHGRYAKWRDGKRVEGDDDKTICEDDGNAYAAFTLPCRRSHCLSEGLGRGAQAALSASMRGRRAQTTQDVTAGEGSEYEDSGIDGVTAEAESRRYKTMSASFSVCSAAGGSVFAGSDSGSSSAGGGSGDCAAGDRTLTCHFTKATGSVRSFTVPWNISTAINEGSLYTNRQFFVFVFVFSAELHFSHSAPGEQNATCCVSSISLGSLPPRSGCTLFFYETDGRSGIDNSSVPKYAIWADNSIVQAVPEHPKKDFVFCLSNSLGDAFLFQTCSQTELENWITAIHSACASAVARQHRREDTVRLVRAEIKKLEQKIDMDEKMKKMGDMQLAAVSDAKKRKTILDQIFLWEQNLEQFHMDLFRFRCYLASLQGGELPNPKRLLAFASRPTKLAMGRLGIFSVSSFHALVAARTESGVRRRAHAMSRSCSKRKSRFSSLWGLDTNSKKKSRAHPSINQVGVRPYALFSPLLISSEEASGKSVSRPGAESDVWVPDHVTPSWVCLPNDQPVLSIIQPGESALCVLETICKAHQLDPTKHYLRLKFLIDNRVQFYIPKPEEDVCDLLYKEIELCSKITKVVQFDRDESCMIGYGFSISVVEEDRVQQLYITDVRAGGLAFAKGLNAGDEILELNGKEAHSLDFSDMKAAFSLSSLALTVSTLPPLERRQLCFLPPRRSDAADDPYTDIFSQSQEEILDDSAGLLLESSGESLDDDSEIFGHLECSKNTEQVSAFCRSLYDMNPPECASSSSPSPDSPFPPALRQLSDADKLRKVISELVETERTYVKDLNCLIGRYLSPLQKESFLTQDELDVLFGNLPEMVQFQVEFLKTLEDGTRLVPDLDKLERVDQFKKILFSLGGSFLYYADRFKIYSAFCASHTKVPKVLVKAKSDPDFKAFLDERNPKQQHSSTLESYLIKPIQRVLKYPLLLRELYSLTDQVSLGVLERRGKFGVSSSNKLRGVADLSMGDLLLHTSVSWINPPPSLGKWKKEPQMATFVFKTAVVFVCKDGSKHKKKMGGSHRVSMSSEEKDPFRYRHMIPTHALQVRPLANGTSVCEIVHTKSESEGRPERAFQLCCSSPESRKDFLKTVHSILREKNRRQRPTNMHIGKDPNLLVHIWRPSAPTRTLGRRKLVRNRFTIDTDIVSDGEPERDLASPPEPRDERTEAERDRLLSSSSDAGDTDRWVEEQFDLKEYEDPEEVKETDILSDEDDGARLDASVAELSLRGEGSGNGHGEASAATAEDHDADQTNVWVLREHPESSPD